MKTKTKPRRYSYFAMALMIGVPVLMYVLAAIQSTEMGEALNQGEATNIADMAMGGSLFLMRIGAIVVSFFSTFIAFFGSPKKSAPRWMVRGQVVEP
jgi:hypothetical protein